MSGANIETRAADAFAKARAELLINAPFWGVLSLRLQPVANPKIDLMNTDGVTIEYNPEAILQLSRAVLRCLIAHETMHCAALHHTRRGTRDAKKWNVACDYAINPVLKTAGLELWEGALLDVAYENLSAEDIYARLPDSAGGQTAQLGGVSDAPTDQPTLSAAEIAQQESDWSIAVAQAEATARAMGKADAGSARAIKEQVAPKINWRDVLRRYLSSADKSDYSWTAPNRRYVYQGLYLPSLHSEALGPVVVAVDTSGSVNSATLDSFAAEITAIFDEAQPEQIHVVYCDWRVKHTEVFQPGDDIILHPQGGEGTAFRPVFEYLSEHDIEPVVTVYLTDLDGYDFGPEPAHPVIWLSTWKMHAPWGEVISHA